MERHLIDLIKNECELILSIPPEVSVHDTPEEVFSEGYDKGEHALAEIILEIINENG